MHEDLHIGVLRALVVVADEKSFSKAAERLFRTQPTISLKIKKLEETVGKKLIQRNNRKVELTKLGHVFYKKSVIILNLFDELSNSNKRIPNDKSLKIGLSNIFLKKSKIIKNDIFPWCSVCFLSAHSIPNLVANGELDIALVAYDGKDNDDYIFEENLNWVCHKNQFDNILMEYSVSMLNEHCVLRKIGTRSFKDANMNLHVDYILESIPDLKSFISINKSISILPDSCLSNNIVTLNKKLGFPKLGKIQYKIIYNGTITRVNYNYICKTIPDIFNINLHR